METGTKINNIKKNLPASVRLIAVSKNQSTENILLAYKAGHKVFGENKVQELVQKYEILPKDIEWHFIGHLQTNKVKFIAPFVSLIHSVDSLKLIETIDAEAKKNNRVIKCLLQIKIASEESKFGLNNIELNNILNSDIFQYKNIRLCGLMGMATFTSDDRQVRDEFRRCKQIFDEIRFNFFSKSNYFNEISMGMSDDYEIAIEEGSTLIRIGSKIFGQRKYTI